MARSIPNALRRVLHKWALGLKILYVCSQMIVGTNDPILWDDLKIVVFLRLKNIAEKRYVT